jgi:two-component system sensor histidine kinase/response regulator
MTLSRGSAPGFPQRQWRSEMNERLASFVPARLRLLAGTVLCAACAPAAANPVTTGAGSILPVLGGVALACGWLAWRRWRPARVEAAAAGARDPKCLQALFAATDDPFQPAPEVVAALAAALPPCWAELPDVGVRIDFDGQAYGAVADAASAAEIGAPIFVGGQNRGRITVAAGAARVARAAEPFPENDRLFLTVVAQRLGSVLQRGVALRALRESEARYRLLCERAPQAQVLLRDGRVLAANRAAVALLGQQGAPALIGKTLLELSSSEQADRQPSAPALQARLDECATGGEACCEWSLLRADGSACAVGMTLAAVASEDPRLVHVTWIGLDAFRRAHHRDGPAAANRTAALESHTRELRAAVAEQRAVFDTVSSGVAVVRDFRVQSSNRSLRRMLGYEAGELVGQQVETWFADPDKFRRVSEDFEQTVEELGAFRTEQMLVRKDRSSFWARLKVKPIREEEFTEGAFVITVEDITDEHNLLLETQRAQAAAEAAARAKADFLANMSHEIRTPMNAVIGLTHLLLKSNIDDSQRQSLQKVQASGQHLLSIINDILDFSRSESGKLSLERVEFELDGLLRSAVGLVGERARTKGLDLVIDLDPDAPTHLVGDPLRIRQVLVNYLGNAVKFTASGEIVIGIAVTRRTQSEVILRFTVSDTGIGIADDHLPRLFESFQQADTSTTRQFGGTGLGLAIAKSLAQLMDGEVGARSVLGKGSQFWFTARLGIGASAPDSLETELDLMGWPVLLAVRNDRARAAIARMLESMALRVHRVATGADAIAELAGADAAKSPFRLFLFDATLTDVAGAELASTVGQMQLAAPPALVFLGVDGDVERLGRNGIHAVVDMPATPSTLLSAVLGASQRRPLLPSAQGEAQPAGAPTQVMAGARVLVVEDNEINREVLTELLTQYGLRIAVAQHGASAVHKVESERFDLVFMDVQMPVMDGLEATRRIRAIPGKAGTVPIVAMTANALIGDRELCLEAGMNDYVSKPVDPAMLDEKLRQWLPARAPVFEFEATVPELPAAVTPPRVLPDDRCLNSETGIRLAAGNVALYNRILDKFRRSHIDHVAEMRVAIASGDWSTARRMAHTLKGEAAQIGAEPLRCDAEQLEHALRKGEAVDRINALLDLVDASLEELLAVLQRRPKPAAVEPKPAVEGTDFEQLRRKLAAQLAANDYESVQTFADHQDDLRSRLGETYESLERAIEDFELESALKLLEQPELVETAGKLGKAAGAAE